MLYQLGAQMLYLCTNLNRKYILFGLFTLHVLYKVLCLLIDGVLHAGLAKTKVPESCQHEPTLLLPLNTFIVYDTLSARGISTEKFYKFVVFWFSNARVGFLSLENITDNIVVPLKKCQLNHSLSSFTT
jgi:sulfur transfer complex TusBCD TusB component (DsrH family)